MASPGAPTPPAVPTEPTRIDGVGGTWLLFACWATPATAAFVAAPMVDGAWHTVLVVVGVVTGLLALYVLVFALLATGIAAGIRASRVGNPLPAWIWVLPSIALGALAGTSAYESGPAGLIAVPLVCLAAATTLVRNRAWAVRTRRRVWLGFGLVAVSSTCVGLTIFLA